MKKIEDEYETLFHYTTFNGLYGIVENNTIWATHFKYLNDKSEYSIFEERLTEYLKPIIHEKIREMLADGKILPNHLPSDIENLVSDEVSIYKSAVYKATYGESYVASFCGSANDSYVIENGLLSQWRGYGRDGGYSIEFDTNILIKMMKMEGIEYNYALIMGDVIYENEENKILEEFSDKIKNLSNHICEIIESQVTGAEIPNGDLALEAMLSIPPRLKHRSFSEEKEVRIVGTFLPRLVAGNDLTKGSRDSSRKQRRLRQRGSEIVPYIELFDADKSSLPIRRIVVGPHRRSLERAEALKVWLEGREIDVAVSDIPYVE